MLNKTIYVTYKCKNLYVPGIQTFKAICVMVPENQNFKTLKETLRPLRVMKLVTGRSLTSR